jgi:hypothetical protein
MILIGLGHKARHGKDSAGEAILDYYSVGGAHRDYIPKTRHYKFAAALYRECHELYGMKEKDPLLLQKIGQERRKDNPNYWVDKVFENVDRDCPDIAVITDVRYQNEAEEIKRRGGYLILVSRLNENGTPFVADDRPADHISETNLDGYNWDFRIITKTGEAALVGEMAITIMEHLRGWHSRS